MLLLNKQTNNTEIKKELIKELYNFTDKAFLPLVKLLNINTFEIQHYNTTESIRALLLELINNDNINSFSCCVLGSTISIDISIKDC